MNPLRLGVALNRTHYVSMHLGLQYLGYADPGKYLLSVMQAYVERWDGQKLDPAQCVSTIKEPRGNPSLRSNQLATYQIFLEFSGEAQAVVQKHMEEWNGDSKALIKDAIKLFNANPQPPSGIVRPDASGQHRLH